MSAKIICTPESIAAWLLERASMTYAGTVSALGLADLPAFVRMLAAAVKEQFASAEPGHQMVGQRFGPSERPVPGRGGILSLWLMRNGDLPVIKIPIPPDLAVSGIIAEVVPLTTPPAPNRKPMTPEEYEARVAKNTRLSGTGLDGTTMHMACPFCGAPDFASAKVLDLNQRLLQGATCMECHRSARMIVVSPAGVFTLVQTAGDDPPAYVPIRRSDASAALGAVVVPTHGEKGPGGSRQLIQIDMGPPLAAILADLPLVASGQPGISAFDYEIRGSDDDFEAVAERILAQRNPGQ